MKTQTIRNENCSDPNQLTGGSTEEILLSEINLGRETQIRVVVSEETVQRYFDRMENEAGRDKFPPILIFRDENDRLWLSDGHHRVMAAKRRKFTSIMAVVRPGTKADAIWEAAKANGQNALQLSGPDMRRAVEMLAADWPDRSNVMIADALGCHEKTVRKYRPARSGSGESEPVKRTGKDGKSYSVRKVTSKNKKTAPKPKEDSLEEDIKYPPGFFRKMEYILKHGDEETKKMLKQKGKAGDVDCYDVVDEIHAQLTAENESAEHQNDETELYEILAEESGVSVETIRKTEYIELNADEKTKEWLRREGGSEGDDEIDEVYNRLKSAEDVGNTETATGPTEEIKQVFQWKGNDVPPDLANIIVQRLPEKIGDILIPEIVAELYKGDGARLDRVAHGTILYTFNRMPTKAQEELFWRMLIDMARNNGNAVAEMVNMMKEELEKPSSTTAVE